MSAERLIGAVISDRYRIHELLAEGGMGAVYRAEHMHMRKALAVKVLHPEMLDNEEAVARFEREAVAGAHIQHPNVASASDFGRLEDGSHFLVLELLDGHDLRTELGSGPLSLSRALRITRQLALGLRAAHQLGIVHRDLKPENVMLLTRDRETDFVKVLDFGISKVPVDRIASARGSPAAALTKLGMVYGTPQYMSPEQSVGEEVDARSDLYSVGVLLYEMLSGERPFDAAGRSELLTLVKTKKPDALRDRGAVVPASVETICMRLLEKRPDDRYPDADALIDALEEVMERLSIPLTARVRPTSSAEMAALSPSPNPPPLALDPRRVAASRDETLLAKAGAPAAAAGARLALTEGASAPAWWAASGLAAVTFVVVIAIGLRSEDTISALEAAARSADGVTEPVASAAPVPPEPLLDLARAPSAEIDRAVERGIDGLEPLAEKYPEDPAVLRKLVHVRAADLDQAADVGSLHQAKRLFEIDETTTRDREIHPFLLRAANGPTDVAKVAMEIMAEHMGEAGPDLLYRLLTADGVGKFPKERAAELLASVEVKRRASPALAIALELRAITQPCARKPLLERAGMVGDERSRAFLRPLTLQHKCGFLGIERCFACGATTAHQAGVALREIDARVKKP